MTRTNRMDEMTKTNDQAYKSIQSPMYRKVMVVLEVALDPVPGWGHNVDDHINQIFRSNPYVLSAIVQG